MDAWRPGSCTSTWTSSSPPSRCSAAPSSPGLPVIVGARGDPTERGRRVDRVVRGPGVRRAVGDAVAHRRAPLPGGRGAAGRQAGVRRGIRRGHGHPARGARRRGARCSAGTRRSSGSRPTTPRRWRAASRPTCSRRPTLHCTVGIGDTKVRAKIATEFGKPRGTFRLTRENWFEVMGERPTGRPVGRRAAHLAAAGRARGDDRARAGRGRGRPCWQRSSARRPGRGSARWAVARAARPSTTPRGCPGRTAGRRPTSGTSSRREVEDALRVLAAQVVDDIRAEGRPCARVHLKVRFAAVLHREPVAQAGRADVGCRGGRRHGARPLPGASRTTAPCGCSACGPRWCRPRVGTSRRAPTAAAACPDLRALPAGCGRLPDRPLPHSRRKVALPPTLVG